MSKNELPGAFGAIQSLKRAINRCYNKRGPDFRHYGGRGITVCDRWRNSHWSIVDDLGPRPSGLTLERVDNDGPYSPENCRWASRKDQVANRRLTTRVSFGGITKPLTEWAEIVGISYNTLRARINQLGYSPEEAFSKPVKLGLVRDGYTRKDYKPRNRENLKRGMSNPKIALNLQQVSEMRKAHYVEFETFTNLSKRYSVCKQTVANAVLGLKAYKDLEC